MPGSCAPSPGLSDLALPSSQTLLAPAAFSIKPSAWPASFPILSHFLAQRKQQQMCELFALCRGRTGVTCTQPRRSASKRNTRAKPRPSKCSQALVTTSCQASPVPAQRTARQPCTGHSSGCAPPPLLLCRMRSPSSLAPHLQSGAQPPSPIAFPERLPTWRAALSRKAWTRKEGGLPLGAVQPRHPCTCLGLPCSCKDTQHLCSDPELIPVLSPTPPPSTPDWDSM